MQRCSGILSLSSSGNMVGSSLMPWGAAGRAAGRIWGIASAGQMTQRAPSGTAVCFEGVQQEHPGRQAWWPVPAGAFLCHPASKPCSCAAAAAAPPSPSGPPPRCRTRCCGPSRATAACPAGGAAAAGGPTHPPAQTRPWCGAAPAKQWGRRRAAEQQGQGAACALGGHALWQPQPTTNSMGGRQHRRGLAKALQRPQCLST